MEDRDEFSSIFLKASEFPESREALKDADL